MFLAEANAAAAAAAAHGTTEGQERAESKSIGSFDTSLTLPSIPTLSLRVGWL
jgi:hypothetical protein